MGFFPLFYVVFLVGEGVLVKGVIELHFVILVDVVTSILILNNCSRTYLYRWVPVKMGLLLQSLKRVAWLI